MEGEQDKKPQEGSEATKTAPAAAAAPANGSPVVAAEATSTTQGEEVLTKRAIRVKTWRKIQEEKCAVPYTRIFNRIPDFIGTDKAAALLADTQEFKDAKNIKVNIDRAQDPVKMQAINCGKNLYLSSGRHSKAIYTKIDCAPDADEKQKSKVIKIQRLKEGRNDIDLENKVKLDMVVVGSVAVSRDGYRIGRGNGFVDLEIAIYLHLGIVTPETVIVTVVHDIQVSDTLPTALFQRFDVPVDIIVTPTEVIRVAKRLPRPTGLFWELLSERRLKIVPVLQIIKENEEKSGKTINLKGEDTDVETNARPQRPRRRAYKSRNIRNRTKMNSENQENVTPRSDRRRRFGGRPRKPRSDGEQSSENKENNQPVRRKRNNRDFCIKVSNIAKCVRIKDLKAELRKRNCNPIYISWKGAFGRCYLHFAKRKDKEREAEIEEVLKSLNDLSLTVQMTGEEQEKTIQLGVELLKIDEEKNRLEAVNSSTV
ncbi:unnamed protein product [Hermetia illucens]|uniref:Methenyltetrahydrofolate synthase domain-containing protein n=1 Tax=Hermetia illucens TaxID=343691 RepID=A0A7R8UPK1_HERIL|nr:methenyltetrahydrofolate synthase domain-containing protein [Hermetia illucens]CAD7084644.1 unnamed protein product [Hermetia illucens]